MSTKNIRKRWRKKKTATRSHVHRNTHITSPDHPPLLVARAEGCRLLGGISVATAIRLEKKKVLIPIKPGRTPTSPTFYSYSNIVTVAQGGVR